MFKNFRDLFPSGTDSIDLTSATPSAVEPLPAELENSLGLNAEPAVAQPSLLKRTTSGLWNRAKAVGASLKQPEFIAQAVPSAAVGALTKAVAGHVAGALVGTSLAATAGVAIVGGAAVSTVLGHLASEYQKSKQTNILELRPENEAWIKRTAREMKDFSVFSAKHIASRRILSTMREEGAKSLLKRAGIGALFSAASFGIAAHTEISNALHGTPHVTPDLSHAMPPVHADAPTIASIPEVHQSALDRAIVAVLSDENASEAAKHSAHEALNGHAWAKNDLIYFLNNAKDGVDLNQALAHDLAAELAPTNKVAEHMLSQMGHAPVQHAVVPVAPQPTPVIHHAPIAEHVSKIGPNFLDGIITPEVADTAETAGEVIVGGAAVAGGAALATNAAPLIAAGALAASQPQDAPVQNYAPRIEQVEALRSQGISLQSQGVIGYKKGDCYISEKRPNEGVCFVNENAPSPTEMLEGDYIGMHNADAPAVPMVAAALPATEETANGKSVNTYSVMKRTIGGYFNKFASALRPVPTAQNDNAAVNLAVVKAYSPR